MTKFFGTHPALIAFLLAGGGVLMLYFGYAIVAEERAEQLTSSDYDLTITWRWLLTGMGLVMYTAGGVCYGCSRGLSGVLSFLLHLLPLLGLILMTIIGRRLTPHELWQRQNPGLDPKTLKRNYRTMKPLY